jgi:Quinolinate synthetase A protein
VSHASKPRSVCSGTSANIVDHGRPSREKATNEFLRPLELQLAPNGREPGFLSSDSSVVGKDFGTNRRFGLPHDSADASYFDISSESSSEARAQASQRTRAPEVLVTTEVGILHRMAKLNSTTRFTAIDARAICSYMKEISPEDVRDSFALDRYRIEVPPETAAKARVALERMVAA